MHLLLATIALRPYVFIFLASFLFIAIVNFGLRTTLLFTVLTYVVALACEWSSVHNGFPFGLYHYLDATRGREIWIAGVPFMDSLSFTFLGFASYTVALLRELAALSPRHRSAAARHLEDSARAARMADGGAVHGDDRLVVDPLSVRGDRWFLGKIFWYDPPGPHFGVPISNYLGWYFVAAITIAIFQCARRDAESRRHETGRACSSLPSRALLGPALYAGIVVFGITMLFVIGAYEYRMGERVHLPAVPDAGDAYSDPRRFIRRRRRRSSVISMTFLMNAACRFGIERRFAARILAGTSANAACRGRLRCA